MTLNLSLLYFVWTEVYCQTSQNKKKSPSLWQITSLLICWKKILKHLHACNIDWFKSFELRALWWEPCVGYHLLRFVTWTKILCWETSAKNLLLRPFYQEISNEILTMRNFCWLFFRCSKNSISWNIHFSKRN